MKRARARHAARLLERGFPAWIDRVEGKRIVLSFFSSDRREFPGLMNGDPGGGGTVFALLADDELRPLDAPPVKFAFLGRPPEPEPAGTYGSAGVRWSLEASELPNSFRPGRVLRIFKDSPPVRGRRERP